MNRVVVSVPRVLDSAMVVTQDVQLQIPAGTIPATATAPLTINHIQSVATETQMTNITITPLGDNTRCARVTATITIPLNVSITDANQTSFETHTNLTKNIDTVLYIPEDTAFPYTITAEGAFACNNCTATTDTITATGAITKILIRVTAVTDLLIPCYGYAPVSNVENNQFSNSQNFLNQPLFPRGKIY
jgi:hypothetical protein